MTSVREMGTERADWAGKPKGKKQRAEGHQADQLD